MASIDDPSTVLSFLHPRKSESRRNLSPYNPGALLVAVTKFGDDIELDPAAYELRRQGRAVRLERIPMEILLLLIERRPELVTREQIVERIWGQGVFLDVDNSINGAIRKIRQALRDDSQEPRFIRTITGKGYRFIATPVEEPASASAASTADDAPPPPPSEPLPPARDRARFGPVAWGIVAVVTIVAVTVAGYSLRASRVSSAAPAPGGRTMLVVLPFDNLTGDAGQDFFCDGFTEEMITRLGSLDPRQLAVIARTSSMHYKHTRAPLEQLARELGVQYVLEGSIRRDARRVRITAQLIQVQDQTHLWARQYDREDTDVLRIQDEIARAIAEQIGPFLGTPRAALEPAPALSNDGYEAYEHYLRGRYLWSTRTADGMRQAVEEFQAALEANSRDARALAGLADAYTLLGMYGYAPWQEAIAKARAAALEALAIDGNLAAAHTSLALINYVYDLDWETAGHRFRKAIELEPNYATAHHWYAEYLGVQGRFDEAFAEIAVARELDPRSTIMAVDHAYILMGARQFDRAIEEFRAALAVEPTFGRAIGGIIGAYVDAGRYDEALVEVIRWREIDDGAWQWATEAHIRGRRGEMQQAEEALRKAEEIARRRGEDLRGLRLLAYGGMRRKEESFALLQAFCEKEPWILVNTKVDPMYDWLRDDPRFEELIRCVGLVP